jgi:adenylate cyclase
MRATYAALRRYVPAVLAALIESGRTVECEEREVSVLFADIRGFISFAESRQATEIFRAVNQYTERVSEIVQRHGGTVIEFSGDGIMALFGAPQRLLDKERAAVAAGRAIIRAMSRGGDAATGLALSVGVGIATGKDCVGDIRVADRVIWSAIGNTTNLAARLQGLTRSLDAAMVIDEATWTAAHPTATDLELRRNVAVRGLRHALTVHVLPLPQLD